MIWCCVVHVGRGEGKNGLERERERESMCMCVHGQDRQSHLCFSPKPFTLLRKELEVIGWIHEPIFFFFFFFFEYNMYTALTKNYYSSTHTFSPTLLHQHQHQHQHLLRLYNGETLPSPTTPHHHPIHNGPHPPNHASPVPWKIPRTRNRHGIVVATIARSTPYFALVREGNIL